MSEHARFAPLGSLRALAYALLWFLAAMLHKAAAACVYLSAGLLRRADLRESSKRMWTGRASAADVDIGLEVWEKRVYDRVLRPSDHILLIGCGDGRDLIALLSEGYAVTGLEQSPQLVQRARAHLAARGLAGARYRLEYRERDAECCLRCDHLQRVLVRPDSRLSRAHQNAHPLALISCAGWSYHLQLCHGQRCFARGAGSHAGKCAARQE